MEDIDLGRFSFDVSEIVAGAAKLKTELDAIRKAQKELTDEGESGSAQFVQNAADIKELNSAYNEHVKFLSSSSKETFNMEARTAALNGVLGEEATTIKALRDQNKLLNVLRNDTNILTDEGQAELKLLNAQLDANNEKIKENVDQYTQQKINIGNYKNDITEALSAQNLMTNGLGGLTGALKTAGTGFLAMTKASLVFLATPIGAVIGVIGLALGAIVNYLKSTQEGMDKVTAVTRPLSAILTALGGILQEVGKFLFDAFSKPKQTIKSVYNFVKDKVMKVFRAYGKILEGILNRDFSKIKEGFSDLSDIAVEAIQKVGESAKQFKDRLVDAARVGAEIDRLQKSIEQREIDIIGTRAQATSEMLKQEAIMRDQLKSDEERAAAIKEHARITEELITAEETITKEKIKQLKLRQSLNDTTREELAELAALEAQLISNQDKRTQGQLKTNRTLSQLENERISKGKKALDERLSKEKELIDLYIAQQGIQSRTLNEQLVLEQAVSEMKLKSLKNELKAKKISQEQYAREVIQIQQGLARMEAEISVEKAGREVEAYRRGFEEQMNERRFLSDRVVKEKRSELNRLLLEEQKFFELKKEQGLINQQEFDDAIFELTEANRLAISEINKEREEVEKQEALELRSLAFEQELERMLEENATKFEIEQAQLNEQFQLNQALLNEQLENGLISQELFDARALKLSEDKARAEKSIDEAVSENKLDIAQKVLAQLSNLIGKESAAGKAVAIAQTTIETYKSAVSAYAAGVSVGGPAGLVLGPVSAGLAVASGLANVKKIISTKIPGESGGGAGGGGSLPSAPSFSGINLTGQNVNLGSANGNVQNQIEQNVNQTTMTEQIADAVMEGAMQGTQQGSSDGITNLSANKQIMESSAF